MILEHFKLNQINEVWLILQFQDHVLIVCLKALSVWKLKEYIEE